MDTISKRSARGWLEPHHLAWFVVLGSFAVFILLCAGVTFGTYWFLFDSATALGTTLTVSKGTVTVIHSDGTSYLANNNSGDPTVAANTILQTDTNSQGYLTFTNDSGLIVGEIFLLPNSVFTFTQATGPRFDFGSQNYSIVLDRASGHFSADLPKSDPRSTVMIVNAALGVDQLDSNGSYLVDASDQSMTLYTVYGNGVLYSVPDHALIIGPTMQGMLMAGQRDPTVQPYPYVMLNLREPGPIQAILEQNIGNTSPLRGGANSLGADTRGVLGLAQHLPELDGSLFDVQGDAQLPLYLACANVPPDDPTEPSGQWRLIPIDQRPALQLFRTGLGAGQNALGHAETRCEFYFPKDPARPTLTGYTSLSIRIKMRLHFQDVTTCGVRGSECPVMIKLDYIDVNGNPQAWYQGFYADRPPQDTSVQRCDTCTRDHEQIDEDAWYLFDSGDLLKQIPDTQRPSQLNYVRVYSSGHLFDVAIGDLSVLAGQPAPSSEPSAIPTSEPSSAP
jgi:hypothetical protein